jgi:NDP-hexose-3-ketoreductase
VGVLGCADIAWRKTIPALRAAGAVIAAVASRDPDRAGRFAARFETVAVTGYDRLLNRADIDVVYIPLPPALHHRWARNALESGRHVILEKPLATSVAEAEDLVSAARAHNRWLTENFAFLHHSQHREVRALVEQGAIGDPQAFTAAFRIPRRPDGDFRHQADLGGGALFDLGVYPVRAAQAVLRSELDVAGAVLHTDPKLNVDVSGEALLRQRASAIPATVSFSLSSAYSSAYTLIGDEGRLTVRRAFTPPADLAPVVELEDRNGIRELTLSPDDQYTNLMRSCLDSMRSGADFAPHAAELLAQARLVERIRNAA